MHFIITICVTTTEAELRNAVSTSGTGTVILNENIGTLTTQEAVTTTVHKSVKYFAQ